MFGHGKRQLLARCRSDGDSSALAESRLHHVILPTVLCVSMFAWTFVQVGLPFYVQGIAGETHATTLRWIGWILGITPILTILTTPMWMRISRHSPMRFDVLMQLLQGSAFVSMALARSLHELFAVRVFLGITGPPTAVAFLIAARSRTSPTTRATSAMQSAMTLGIITGPLAAGTLTARVGYTGSFLIGGMLLVGCAALVGRNAPDARGHDAMARSESARPSIVDIAALCLISLWCRMRTGNGSMGALPVVTVDQARSWVSYWQEMRGVPANSFTLSEYLPGRDFAVQGLWKGGNVVLLKICERLSYFGGKNQPSGSSSTPALGKLVVDARVREICERAIRVVDPGASGVFSVDLKEDETGTPCITEINAGRFCMITNIFDLAGNNSMARAYLQLAFDAKVELTDTGDSDDYYLVRDLDTLPTIFQADSMFERIREVDE